MSEHSESQLHGVFVCLKGIYILCSNEQIKIKIEGLRTRVVYNPRKGTFPSQTWSNVLPFIYCISK